MIKGLYSAFTAMDAAWQYQDVLANNIANSSTAGFKREVGAQQSFDDVLLCSGHRSRRLSAQGSRTSWARSAPARSLPSS